MNDYFRIAVRVEPMTQALQFLAQLYIVEYLAVERDPDGLILVVPARPPAAGVEWVTE